MRRLLPVVVLMASLFAGCGDDGDGHNEADVTFVEEMVPHHEQAVEMARLAPTRAQNARVKELAADIESAQGPEIQRMNGWIRSWGATTTTMDSRHVGHDGMPGMMTGDDMKVLEGASGNDFDRRFLLMMVRHHDGAVKMAETELKSGQNDEVQTLAEAIKKTQTAEVAEMRDLLTKI